MPSLASSLRIQTMETKLNYLCEEIRHCQKLLLARKCSVANHEYLHMDVMR